MTDLPHRDDCNESELFSRESFTENWTGNAEESCGADAERVSDILDTSYRVCSGLSRLAMSLVVRRPVPKFEWWTFFDEATGKIHAAFDDERCLAAFLTSKDFSAFWYAINEERSLFEKLGYLIIGCDDVTLKCGDLELVPTKFEQSEWKDVPFSYPVEWVLHNRSPKEVNLDELIKRFGSIVVKGDVVAPIEEYDIGEFYPF